MSKVKKTYCLTLFQTESDVSLFFESDEKIERIEAIIGIIHNEATASFNKGFITNESFLDILKDEIDLELLDMPNNYDNIVFLERKTIGTKYHFMYKYLKQDFTNCYTESLNVGSISIDAILEKILVSEFIEYHY